MHIALALDVPAEDALLAVEALLRRQRHARRGALAEDAQRAVARARLPVEDPGRARLDALVAREAAAGARQEVAVLELDELHAARAEVGVVARGLLVARDAALELARHAAGLELPAVAGRAVAEAAVVGQADARPGEGKAVRRRAGLQHRLEGLAEPLDAAGARRQRHRPRRDAVLLAGDDRENGRGEDQRQAKEAAVDERATPRRRRVPRRREAMVERVVCVHGFRVRLASSRRGNMPSAPRDHQGEGIPALSSSMPPTTRWISKLPSTTIAS